jgi:hypothetical protein
MHAFVCMHLANALVLAAWLRHLVLVLGTSVCSIHQAHQPRTCCYKLRLVGPLAYRQTWSSCSLAQSRLVCCHCCRATSLYQPLANLPMVPWMLVLGAMAFPGRGPCRLLMTQSRLWQCPTRECPCRWNPQTALSERNAVLAVHCWLSRCSATIVLS